MFGKNLRYSHTAIIFSVPFFLTAFSVQPAFSNLDDYTPTLLTNSAYQISFSSADENDYDIINYEEENGQWQKQYYKYSYDIKGCPGNNCSSNNRLNNIKTGIDYTQNFYGLRNSAIDNTNGSLGNITGDFVKNSADRGGAINNYEYKNSTAKIGDLQGDFINNSATIYGGAIYNSADVSGNSISNAIIGNIKGNFIGNSSGSLGGAIYNSINSTSKVASIGNIDGNFINNSSGWGGAIYNDATIQNITGDFISNNAEDGGAIMNTREMGNITGNFLGNTASGYGGAIYLSNYATTGKIKGDFVGNTAVRSGGAIFNSSAKKLDVEGNFIDNHGRFGGAIFNISRNDGIFPAYAQITNSSFIDNTAVKLGGAIYHQGDLDIIANNYESVFQGNTADGASNALYIGNDDDYLSTVNLIAENGGSITFYDEIDGEEGYKLKLSGDADSQINFHADIHNGDIIVGTPEITRAAADTPQVNFDDINNISNKNNSFIINNGTVTFDDLELIEHKFRELQLAGGEININNVNVDLANTTMGRLTANDYTGGDTTVKVHNLNVISDNDDYTAVDFADTSFSGQVTSNITSARGPVYDYAVDYLPDNGQFTFQRARINDEVKVPSYAAVAAVSVLSDEIYSRVLSDADTYFDTNTAENGVKPFAKVFGSDDSIDLKGLEGGNSKFYGAILGAETNPIEIGSGWKSVYNAYFAYALGENEFASERVDQESGYVGVSGILYKDNFFVGSTINTAIVQNKVKGYGENDKFTSYLSGIGFKTGYNVDLGSDYTIQPNLYGSYTYIKSHDYKTKRNALVKFDDMSNFELAPGLKLSKNFDEGLELYMKGRYVFIFNEDQKARANGVLLPDIELEDYAELGIGIAKNWEDIGLNSFLEVSRREGGREGWNGLAGVKLAL